MCLFKIIYTPLSTIAIYGRILYRDAYCISGFFSKHNSYYLNSKFKDFFLLQLTTVNIKLCALKTGF